MLSHDLFTKAQTLIPGGVNSPVRAFKAVGGEPLFIKKGSGAYITDVDNKQYIDYVGSWGPMILGHAHPKVLAAVELAIQNGLSFGAPTALEVEMAARINELMPSMEMLRMVNSGTEATMSAIRLARGFTGRDKIIKFEGCYHGHADSLLVKAGSGALTFGVPSSPGVPASFAEHTLNATFNDIESVAALFEEHRDTIAAVIIEPVAGNMNLIPPSLPFLQALREMCDHNRTVLIFDEVMCGFRVGLGGAQEKYGVQPDLTTLGKVIGGGMPVGAFGGSAAIMEHLAPNGPVYQAGTLSGNPIAMAAGLATLNEISKPGFFESLTTTTEQLMHGLKERASAANIAFTTNQVGSMFGLFFSHDQNINCFAQVTECDLKRFSKFFHGMLHEGVYLAPSAFETGFVSSAHGTEEIQMTLNAAEKVFQTL